MGVPKFFRYISERYPCLSELVKEYQIPEFDNLYLDMNGIIHMCSHPDDNNPHFRITEEKIFQDIFHYIEVLFRMIRPRKLFFMAVDGVAPRAKMNQQRGRRFRSAKDAEKQEADARKNGEKLPDVARFDSNCITPGTVFMARLHEQLKYFVVEKISNDPTWQSCKVILSGHETPGEGEHKIMDYIRFMRAQPGYDPNTRHCLYGLDADLIMLGLCTHEPHFSLLREEVKFGKKSTKRVSVPEEITFYLLHLSLMREYLELEFAPLRNRLQGYEYDFEKIIDDWVLMGFLVGNDFIPHLPNLHITNGALPVLYKAYMDILPTLDGYINEAGTLNLARFEKFMAKLSEIDLENFEEIKDDLLYMEAKTGKKWTSHGKVSTRNLEEWVDEEGNEHVALESLEPEKQRDSGLQALIQQTDEMCIDSETEEEDDAFECYKKEYYRNKLEYEKVTPEVMRDQAEGYVRAIQWNLNYYYNGCCSWSWYYPHHYAPYISDIKGFSNLKIEFDLGQPFLPFEQLLAVLPAASKELLPPAYHHLMTSKNSIIKQYYPEDFQTDLNGKKQEWEAVVLVPFIDEDILLEAMSDCNDQLTKDEKNRNKHGPMLVYTYTSTDMGPYSPPEYFPPVPQNHSHVTALLYDDVVVPKEKLIKGAYPGVRMNVYYPGFPTMKHLKYKAELRKAKIKVFETPSRNENMIITIIPDEKFAGEMIPVDLLGTSVFIGWPHLVEAKVVSISNSKRRYISMGGPNEYNVEERTGHMIHQFKQEVDGIMEQQFRGRGPKWLLRTNILDVLIGIQFVLTVLSCCDMIFLVFTALYQKRMGIEYGETKVLVHVQVMIGRRYVFAPNGRITLEKQFTPNISNYPLQTVVFNICAFDDHHSVFRDVESVFPKGCTCFTLTNPYYGSQGIVQDSKEPLKNGRIKICISVLEEPDFSLVKEYHAKVIRSYKTLYNAASQLSMTNYLFSRVTGSIYITARNNEGGLKNVNVGLDLKFTKKNKETPGFTKKIGTTWYYTDRAVDLVRLYSEEYPEIFSFLSQDEKFEDINAETIFKEDCDEKLKELQNWLKSLPSHSLERRTCGSAVLEPDVVNVIERIIDNCPKSQNAKKVTMQIKPSFLYRPEIQSGTLMPDPKMDTKILDRVVNVRNGFTVPLGLKGTIVSIHESTSGSDRDIMYDVVFDKPFKDGMTLNCSDNRGYRLPKTAFINISYGQRLMEEKTGKPDELIAKAEASQKTTHNNSHNSYKERNNPANYTPQQFNQQPPQQQQWRVPANQQQQHTAYQNQQPFQKESSAFVQFSNAMGQIQPHPSPQYNPTGPPPSFYNYAKPVKQNYNQQPSYSQQQKNQGNSSNPQVNQRFGGFQRNVNNFMPTFNREQQEENRLQQQRAQQSPQKRVNSNNQPKSEGNGVPVEDQKPRASVNTEFLKTILQIGNDTNKSQEKSLSNLNKPSTSQKDMKEKDVSPNVSFEIFAEAAKAPASVRLLTYYQSNGLGLPRYQYFNCGKLIQSQITLANGELIVGKPAKTREEASENVACDVLDIFLKKAKEANLKQMTEVFPAPPKTWVQPQSNRSSTQNSKSLSNHDGSNRQAETRQSGSVNKSKSDAAVLNNSFIPLQAIKNHISKASNSTNKQTADGSKENILERQESSEVSNSSNKNNQKDQTSPVQSENKPKKQRQTRIAAIFNSTNTPN